LDKDRLGQISKLVEDLAAWFYTVTSSTWNV
jgi:hypothetical protein